MPEPDAPVIDTSDEEDPIWERLVVAVQAADSKRSVDISAFWVNSGFEIIVLITALSRPQLQAIASTIERDMKAKLRLRRRRQLTPVRGTGGDGVRAKATVGWVIMKYARLTIHVMMPVQRSYYDLEGLWRDEWEDYEEIDLQEILRESTFGNMRLKKELVEMEPEPVGQVPAPDIDEDDDFADDPVGYHEPEEDDPFWS